MNLLVDAAWLTLPVVFVLAVAAGLLKPHRAPATVRWDAEDRPGKRLPN